MPELPEVEVTRRGLLPHVPDQRVTALYWSDKNLRLPIPRQSLKRHIQGKSITAIDRRAKYLLFRMENGAIMVLHLGMTGKLGLFPLHQSRAKHDHLCLTLSNSIELRFNDSRRFGSIQVWGPGIARDAEVQFSNQEGVEPFSPTFTGKLLFQLAQKRKVAVKVFLMNGKIIAGIGNIYANEILFTAAIHPQKKTADLQLTDWQRIAKATRTTLNQAIKAGGTTISDFIGSSGNPGYFQLELKVYDQDGNPCKRCQEPLKKEKLAGRATYFCPVCQH